MRLHTISSTCPGLHDHKHTFSDDLRLIVGEYDSRRRAELDSCSSDLIPTCREDHHDLPRGSELDCGEPSVKTVEDYMAATVLRGGCFSFTSSAFGSLGMCTSVGMFPARTCFGVLVCFHWNSKRNVAICVLNRVYVPGGDDYRHNMCSVPASCK